MCPDELLFSSIKVTREAFYKNKYAFAIVNKVPLVPGHVLVVPNHKVSRICDLTPTEASELFQTVQRVGRFVKKIYHADDLTIVCQDGKAAGQTVPHVHVHIIPRKTPGPESKFEEDSDEIYHVLDDHRAEHSGLMRAVFRLRVDECDRRLPRSIEDMIQEAGWLKDLFEQESEIGSRFP